MRLVIVEVQHKNFDEKLDNIMEAIAGFRRTAFWFTTLIGGSLTLALLKFIYDGGLTTTVARAAGL